MSDYEFDPERRPMSEHAFPPVRATAAMFVSMKDGLSDEERAEAEAFVKEADEYFSQFAQSVVEEKDGKKDTLGAKCFHCGEYLTGMGSALLGNGGFTWGLAHGEGFCRACRWPVRAHHFAKKADGSELFTLRNFPLSYHPDFVSKRDEAA